jgi:hypothetical protein
MKFRMYTWRGVDNSLRNQIELSFHHSKSFANLLFTENCVLCANLLFRRKIKNNFYVNYILFFCCNFSWGLSAIERQT